MSYKITERKVGGMVRHVATFPDGEQMEDISLEALRHAIEAKRKRQNKYFSDMLKEDRAGLKESGEEALEKAIEEAKAEMTEQKPPSVKMM